MNLEEENNLIEAYLDGRLTLPDREAFERRMIDDEGFRESVLLQKQLSQALNEKDWSFAEKVDQDRLKSYETEFRRQETKDLAATLKKINVDYQSQESKRKRNFGPWLLYLSAAIIAVLIAVNGLLPSTYTPEELYANYYDSQELPSLVVRGENQSELAQAQLFFEKGDYLSALPVIEEQLVHESGQKATLYVYKGIAEMELNQYTSAAQTFETLSTSELLDASKGLWYAAILELKQGRIFETKKALERVIASPTNYKFKEAKNLLDEL